MDNLSRAVELAEDFKTKQAEVDEQARIESLTPEQKEAEEASRNEEETKIKEAEEQQAKTIEEEDEILIADDSELDEEKLKLKQEIIQREEGEDDIAKLKKAQKRALKRIDKVTKKFHETEEALTIAEAKHAAEIEALRKQLEKKDAPVVDISKIEQERIIQYAREDADKPYEDKREMSREELEEWIEEDPVEAQEWIAKRTLRREKERTKDEQQIRLKQDSEEFLEKQKQSTERMAQKYPNTRPLKRANELRQQGKSEEELVQILKDENPEFRIMLEIIDKDPTIVSKIDAGDLMLKKLDEQMAKLKTDTNVLEADKNKTYTQAELDAKIKEAQEMEKQRLANVDVGDGSSVSGKVTAGNITQPKVSKDEQMLRKEVEKLNLRGANLDVEKVVQRHKDRKSDPALRNYLPGGDDNE